MEDVKKSCGAVERDFKFWMPLDVAVEKAGTKQMRVGGIASDESAPDLQGERVFVEGLETDYLLERGAFNWNHGKEPGDILGEIDVVDKSDGKLHVAGFLYPHVKQAVDTYNLMRSMKDSGSKRKLGLSIEGKIKERNGKEVRKAWLKAVALTYNPINQGSWVDVIKSLEGLTFSKCAGDCGHCTFHEKAGVEKAQQEVIDPRTDVLATQPAPSPTDSVMLPDRVCEKCGRGYVGDACTCDPRGATEDEAAIAKSDKAIKEIIGLLAENPSPPDKDVHALADRLGMAHDKLESIVYSILGEIVKRGKGVDPDPKELGIGIKVEQEHTKYPELARFIALTHLKELPDYYTKLKEMEAKKAVKEGDLEKQLSTSSSGMAAGYDAPATSGGVGGSALRKEDLDKDKKVTTYDERHLGIKKFTNSQVKDMVKACGYGDEVSERVTELIFKASRVKAHAMKTKGGKLAWVKEHQRKDGEKQRDIGVREEPGTYAASYPPIKFPKKFSNNGAIEKFILKIAKTNANDPALGRAVERALNTFPLSSNKILWEDNLEALPEKTRAIVEQAAEISDNRKAINSVDFQMRYGMSREEAEKVYPFGRAKKPSGVAVETPKAEYGGALHRPTDREWDHEKHRLSYMGISALYRRMGKITQPQKMYNFALALEAENYGTMAGQAFKKLDLMGYDINGRPVGKSIRVEDPVERARLRAEIEEDREKEREFGRVGVPGDKERMLKAWPESKTEGSLGQVLTHLHSKGQSKVRSHPRFTKHGTFSLVGEHPRINKEGKDGYSRLKNMLRKMKRKAKEDTYSSLGMKKVKGSMGGTFWE